MLRKENILLMIFLGFHFAINRRKNRYTNLILIGLFFAFLGDVFLLFKNQGARQTLFFLLGLGSFLITQLCYFFAFLGYAKGNGFAKKSPWILLPFIFFLIGNTYMLWGDLPAAFRLPVNWCKSIQTGECECSLCWFSDYGHLYYGTILNCEGKFVVGRRKEEVSF